MGIHQANMARMKYNEIFLIFTQKCIGWPGKMRDGIPFPTKSPGLGSSGPS
jgi:hypothetical protein